MSNEEEPKSPHRQWAEFRFSVVGHLLAAPLKKGDLAGELRRLSEKSWRHPQSGEETKLGFSTIEGWYYAAKNEKRDPIGKLRSKPRSDMGKSRRISDDVGKVVVKQYGNHPSWSYKLHADNLHAALRVNAALGVTPSYSTVRRYMKGLGLRKQKKPRNAASAAAINRVEAKEVRLYEVEYVNSLWHLDFHKSELKVVSVDGDWQTPVLLGVFDDHSRLSCHMQWYLRETAENLVHAFSQALMKRALPRELLTDNGKPMVSHEFKAGLTRLSIVPKNTLPYSPYQNGKCENTWTKVDGRLVAMLESYKDLTLNYLNDVTQAWVEMEYNRAIHEETKERPIDRYLGGKDVGRPAPAPDVIRNAFRREVRRIQRRSDGTITIDGTRFEIPSRFRHVQTITAKYAFWDLSLVHMIDFRTGEEIARIYPVDKVKNADGLRRTVEEPIVVATPQPTRELPPLLTELIDEYRALGLRPAYLPKSETENYQNQKITGDHNVHQ
ncbi:MAG TPA: IS481 family transposase [Chloroflexi bacterium]|jgi:transposase InsO family protein|nr:IS481 family transposase [Chloroflexota bacterium]